MDLYLLFESAAGYALFERKEWDEVAAVENDIEDVKSFSKVVKLLAFHPFATAEEALAEINAIAEGSSSETLLEFLALHLPKKKKHFKLGVQDVKLGESLASASYGVTLAHSSKELLRGCRMHLTAVLKQTSEKDMDAARCGLAHSYSRSKISFDPNRQDKPILNTSALLDGLDKNINTFAMRVREWYGWHFPELAKLVTDNHTYAKAVLVLDIKDNFDWEGRGSELLEVLANSEEIFEAVKKASQHSMGTEIVEMDMQNIRAFAGEVVKLSEMRVNLQKYLKEKMDVVAPNLTALIGETVGARLISHAGSLTNLAKYPASTIQILGAEKALFRALKTKGNTPKYGLIYHSSFIGRAASKNKGRISRYLANKCSIASRIDCFADQAVTQGEPVFGDKMREQVEERLLYLADGVKPRKNLEVMEEAKAIVAKAAEKRAKKDAKKAAKRKLEEQAPAPEVEEAPEEEVKPKKAKKAKKNQE
jgi:nucleolar protein 56